jgi:hypothetical protein
LLAIPEVYSYLTRKKTWDYANTVRMMVVVLLAVQETEVKGSAAVMEASHDQKQSDRLKANWCITETLSSSQSSKIGRKRLCTHRASGPAAARLGGCVGKGISLAKSKSLLLADGFAVFGGALRLIVAADAPFCSSYAVVVRRSCGTLGPSWLSGEDPAAMRTMHIQC